MQLFAQTGRELFDQIEDRMTEKFEFITTRKLADLIVNLLELEQWR